MAKKDKVVEEEVKKVKKVKKNKVAEPAPEPEKKKKKKEKQEEPAPEPEKVKGKKDKKKKATAESPSGDTWDEQTGGGGDFFKLPAGENEVLIRVRSVVSMGQCVHIFKGKPEGDAKSTLALVLECWPYKIKGDKIKITSDQPAIVYHNIKAVKGNKDSHYTAMLKEVSTDNKPSGLFNAVGQGVVFTSDKGYMYLRQRIKKAGLAEKQATPKVSSKGHLVPNLNAMTEDAMKDLNPILQVQSMMEQAINFNGTVAEDVLEAIRKDKPDFARLKPKDGESSGASPKKKSKKRKLDDSVVH